MLYNTIQNWLDLIFAKLNAVLPEDIKLRQSLQFFNPDLMPRNLLDKSYTVKINEINFPESEAVFYAVNTIIDFHFSLYKNQTENYRNIIDSILINLCKILNNKMENELEFNGGNFTIAEITDIKISGLNLISKNNEFIFPKIEFKLYLLNNS